MKRKMRKFSDGGVTEGQNPNIDDETRSRARKWMEEGSPEQDTGAKPVTITKTKTSVTASKPKEESPDEYKDRMEKLTKSQAIERVEPENYIPGPGLLKGMFKSVVRAGEKRVAKEAAETAAEAATKKAARRSEEGFDPAEALKQLKPRKEAAEVASLKKEATSVKKRIADNDVAEKRLRTRIKNDEGSASVRERASKLGMKSGGSVRSSASRRADGCAIRGKTRA